MIKIQLLSKDVKSKDGTRKFRTFFTPVNIVVKGEEDKGAQKKYLTVKFKDGVEHSNLKRGILTCKDEDIWIPYVYEITENQETGKKEFPTVWVRGYEDYQVTKSNRQNTCVPILDEVDTDEVVLPTEGE